MINTQKFISIKLIVVIILNLIYTDISSIFANDQIEIEQNNQLNSQNYFEEKLQKLSENMYKNEEVSNVIKEKLNIDLGGTIDKNDVKNIIEKVNNSNLDEKSKQILEKNDIVDFIPIYDEPSKNIEKKAFNPSIVTDGKILTTDTTTYDLTISNKEENKGNIEISLSSKIVDEFLNTGEIVNNTLNTNIDDYTLSIEPLNVNKDHKINYFDDKVIHENYMENIDKIYTIQKDGIKEDLIVKKPHNKNYHVFLYKIKTKGLNPIENNDGSIDFINNQSGSIMYIPAPFFIDIKGNIYNTAYYQIIGETKDLDENLDKYYDINIDEINKKNDNEITNNFIFNFFKALEETNKDDIQNLLLKYWKNLISNINFENNNLEEVNQTQNSSIDLLNNETGSNLDNSKSSTNTDILNNLKTNFSDTDEVSLLSNFFNKALAYDTENNEKEYLLRLIVLVDKNVVYPIDIDPTIKIRLFAYNNNLQFAYSEAIGYIATYNPFVQGLSVYDNYVKGWLWSNTVGWIKLNGPENGPYLNTDETNYGVNIALPNLNNLNAPRALTGYAYSLNIGWIEFSNDLDGSITPYNQQNKDDYGVYLASGGMLYGYAWSDNVGWIAFNYSINSGSVINEVNTTLQQNILVISTGATLATNSGITVLSNTGNTVIYYTFTNNECNEINIGTGNTWYLYTGTILSTNTSEHICYAIVSTDGNFIYDLNNGIGNIAYVGTENQVWIGINPPPVATLPSNNTNIYTGTVHTVNANNVTSLDPLNKGVILYQYCLSTGVDTTEGCILSQWTTANQYTYTNLQRDVDYYYYVRTKYQGNDELVSAWSSTGYFYMLNEKPVIKSANIIPSVPNLGDPITINYVYFDTEDLENKDKLVVEWIGSNADGSNQISYLFTGISALTLSGEYTDKTNEKFKKIWKAKLKVFDGYKYSDIYEIPEVIVANKNLPPVVSDLDILNQDNKKEYFKGDILRAFYKYYDFESAEFGSSTESGTIIRWYLSKNNGLIYTLVHTGLTLDTNLYNISKGDLIKYTILPKDNGFGSDNLLSATGIMKESNSIRIKNSIPVINNLSITGSNVDNNVVISNILASDKDNDNLIPYVKWYINDVEYKNYTGLELSKSVFKKGDKIYAKIRMFDGQDYSLEYLTPTITIQNSKPDTTNATITFNLSDIYINSKISAKVNNVIDFDKDPITYNYIWTISGTNINNNSPNLDLSLISKDLGKLQGKKLRLSVIPFDGTESGDVILSEEKTILNTKPKILSAFIVPYGSNVGNRIYPNIDDNIRIVYNVFDADNDTDLIYTVKWYESNDDGNNFVERTDLQNKFELLPNTFSTGSVIKFSMQINDGLDDSDLFTSNMVKIGVENIPPMAYTIQGENQTNINIGENISFIYHFYDKNIPPKTQTNSIINWYRNGELVNNVNYSVIQIDKDTTKLVLDKSEITRGDTWYVEIIPFNGYTYGSTIKSPEYKVSHPAPILSGANITITRYDSDNSLPNNQLRVIDTLTINPIGFYNYEDLDKYDFSGTILVTWILNGKELNDVRYNNKLSISLSDFKVGDKIYAKLTPYDGVVYGNPVYTEQINIVNTKPKINDIILSYNTSIEGKISNVKYDDTIYIHPIGWYDPDGDKPQYIYQWIVNGNIVYDKSFGKISEISGIKIGDNVTIKVIPINGDIQGDFKTVSFVVGAENPFITYVGLSSNNGYTFDAQGNIIPNKNDSLYIIKPGDIVYAAIGAKNKNNDGKLSVVINWYDANGRLIGTGNSITVPSNILGLYYEVTVIDNKNNTQSKFLSATYDIEATTEIPHIINNPSIIFSGNTLTIDNIQISTGTGETKIHDIKWYKNGQLTIYTGTTIPSDAIVYGDKWYAVIIPADGKYIGQPYITDEFIAIRSNPVVKSTETIVNRYILSGSELVFVTYKSTGAIIADKSSPIIATVNDVIVQGMSKDSLIPIYTWYINDQKIENFNNDTLPTSMFKKGDNIYYTVQVTDGFVISDVFTSSLITVVNAIPTIDSISLPQNIYIKDRITFTPKNAYDPDEDEISYEVQWYVNGIPLNGENNLYFDLLPEKGIKKGDNIKVVVTIKDGTTNGNTVEAQWVISDSPPNANIPIVMPKYPYRDNDFYVAAYSGNVLYTGNIVLLDSLLAYDNDGDAFIAKYQWYKNGIPMWNESGAILSSKDVYNMLRNAKGDKITFEVSVYTDSKFIKSVISDPVMILNSPPNIISITISKALYYINSILEWSAVSKDIDQDTIEYAFVWQKWVSDLVGWVTFYTGNTAIDGRKLNLSLFNTDNSITKVRIGAKAYDGLVYTNTGDLFYQDSWYLTSSAVDLSNSRPIANNVKILNQNGSLYISAGDTIYVSYDYKDINNDPEDIDKRIIKWYKNGQFYSTSSYISNVSSNDRYYYELIISDGYTGSILYTSNDVIVDDFSPYFTGWNLTYNPKHTDRSQDIYATYSSSDVSAFADIRWYRTRQISNNVIEEDVLQPFTGNVLLKSDTLRGDYWYYTVRFCSNIKCGPMYIADKIQILNTPPYLTATPLIYPANPTMNDTLHVLISGWNDIDGDNISTNDFLYQWYINDKLYTGSTSGNLGSSHFKVGDIVYVVVTPRDGYGATGSSVISNKVTIRYPDGKPIIGYGDNKEPSKVKNIFGYYDRNTGAYIIKYEDPSEDDLDHIVIERAVNNDVYNKYAVIKPKIQMFADKNISVGNTYKYRLYAVDKYDMQSSLSMPLIFTLNYEDTLDSYTIEADISISKESDKKFVEELNKLLEIAKKSFDEEKEKSINTALNLNKNIDTNYMLASIGYIADVSSISNTNNNYNISQNSDNYNLDKMIANTYKTIYNKELSYNEISRVREAYLEKVNVYYNNSLKETEKEIILNKAIEDKSIEIKTLISKLYQMKSELEENKSLLSKLKTQIDSYKLPDDIKQMIDSSSGIDIMSLFMKKSNIDVISDEIKKMKEEVLNLNKQKLSIYNEIIAFEDILTKVYKENMIRNNTGATNELDFNIKLQLNITGRDILDDLIGYNNTGINISLTLSDTGNNLITGNISDQQKTDEIKIHKISKEEARKILSEYIQYMNDTISRSISTITSMIVDKLDKENEYMNYQSILEQNKQKINNLLKESQIIKQDIENKVFDYTKIEIIEMQIESLNKKLALLNDGYEYFKNIYEGKDDLLSSYIKDINKNVEILKDKLNDYKISLDKDLQTQIKSIEMQYNTQNFIKELLEIKNKYFNFEF